MLADRKKSRNPQIQKGKNRREKTKRLKWPLRTVLTLRFSFEVRKQPKI